MDSLIWVVLLSPSLILFGIWLRLKARAAASESWPSTTGRVTFVWPGPRYPAVDYKYSVEGQELTGKRIWFGERRALLPSHSKGIGERYLKGEQVTVYYNPKKPRESVLERRAYAPFMLTMALVWTICIGQAMFTMKR